MKKEVKVASDKSKSSNTAHILLISENLASIKQLQSVLQDRYTVNVSKRLSADVISESTPDLVMIDLTTPKTINFSNVTTGFSSVSKNRVPLVVLVGSSIKQSLLQKLETKVDDVLIEPVSNRELLSHIQLLLRIKGLRKKADEAAKDQEKQLRLITDALPAFVAYIDSKRRYRFANKAYEEWFGLKLENIYGKHMRDILGEEGYIRIRDRVDSALQGEKIVYDNILERKGEVKYIDGQYIPDYDEHGNVRGIVTLAYDVTQRKIAETKLIESEKRFRTMADSAPVIIWMADTEGLVSYVNKKWLDFTGRTLKQEVVYGWTKSVHPEDLERTLALFKNAYVTKEEFKVELRMRRFDGTYRWMLNHGVPRFSATRGFSGYIGSCIDITDRLELEQRKTDFISMASHELKTPLTSLKAYSQILEKYAKQENDDYSKTMLKKMDNQIDKLTKLIADLLDVSRIQSGKIKFAKKKFPIDTLVRDTVENIQVTVESHKIVLRGETGANVYADRERVGQIIINLLTNAIKYSPPKSKIKVKIAKKLNQVSICVQDFGIGIDKEKQQKIFERFYQVSEDAGLNQSTYSGLGIGLYITNEIAKQHDGIITVSSKKGKGSTFCLLLPTAD